MPSRRASRSSRVAAAAFAPALLWLSLLVGCGRSEPPPPIASQPPLQGDAALPDAAPNEASLATEGGAPDALAPFVSFADPERTLLIVAHPDDDLWLMNPNLLNTLRLGRTLETIFLTDGAAGLPCDEYALSRAQGVFEAYAQMAGVPQPFPGLHEERRGERTVLVAELVGAPVRLLFLGLPNAPVEVASELYELWQGTRPSLETSGRDGRSRQDAYTRDDLIETLAQLIAEFAPAQVNFLDASQLVPPLWPFEHIEHVVTALFALSALERVEPRPAMRMFRAYNIQGAPANVSAPDATLKRHMLDTYIQHDPKICPSDALMQVQLCGLPLWCDLQSVLYLGYEQRQYPIAFAQHGAGLLVASDGRCLRAAHAEQPAQLALCDPADPAQRWQVRRGGFERLSGEGCLRERGGAGARRLVLSSCQGDPAQQLMLTSQGQLRSAGASCVQHDGGQLSLASCGFLERQLGYTLARYGAPFLASQEASDAQPAATSLGLVELTPGQAALCERRSHGVYCAAFLGEQARFAPFQRVSEQFRDEQGFVGAGLGELQLGDLNGDGLRDVCARAADGVYCAFLAPGGNQLQGYARVWESAADGALERPLRLVDLDGDGRAELCMRSPEGLACTTISALDSPAAPQLWSDAFSDQAGYGAAGRGSTLQLADVNGDGANDACLRAADGVRCALNDGTAFVLEHAFSHPGEYVEPAGSDQPRAPSRLHLPDVDGDGLADLCSTSAGQLRCGLSTGSSFSQSWPVLPPGVGWEELLGGPGATSLGFADLNGDGRSDLCVRAGTAVHCGYALMAQ